MGTDSGPLLVVDDEEMNRDMLARRLQRRGYVVEMAADGQLALDMVAVGRFDLVLLDIMMPGWSGLDILEELRRRGEEVPVLMLSARNKTPDKVTGLNLGADDYLAKPFDLPELIARIEAMLRRRRSEAERDPPLRFGNVVIDRAARRVQVGHKTVKLSAREFDLLCLLAASPGQVFTRELILEKVWGWDYEGTARTVDNFVASLRKKLGALRRPCRQIQTVPRVGYKLEP